MINHQNDIFGVTQKSFSSPTGSWVFIVQDSVYQKTGTDHSQPIMKREKNSFIADWQMPQLEKH